MDGKLLMFKHLPIKDGRCKLIGVSDCPHCYGDDYEYHNGSEDGSFEDDGTQEGHDSQGVDGGTPQKRRR